MQRFANREQYEDWKWKRMQEVGIAPSAGTLALKTNTFHHEPAVDGENTWATLCHLAALLGLLVPFGSILGPWLVWSMKKDFSRFVDRHGKAVIAFQSRIFMATLSAWLLALVFALFAPRLIILPMVAGVLLPMYALLMALLGASAAHAGERFRYPVFWSPNG